MTMSATMASGIVSDMPKVATKGLVQTTDRALHRSYVVKATQLCNISNKNHQSSCNTYQK
jgi:hypothetical protein